MLRQPLRAEHAAIDRMIRVAAHADGAAVLDADEHAAADRAVAAGRRHPACPAPSARRCSRQPDRPRRCSDRRACRVRAVASESCGLACRREVGRGQVLGHHADEEQVAAERSRRRREAQRDDHHAAPASTGRCRSAARPQRAAAAPLRRARAARRAARSGREQTVDSSRAVPRSSRLSDAMQRKNRSASSTTARRPSRPRPSASQRGCRRRRRRRTAARALPAVRLNCSSVNGVFHAGRDGTR